MWQLIIVIIIGIVAVGYVGYRIYHFVTKPKSGNPCDNCPGCALTNDRKK